MPQDKKKQTKGTKKKEVKEEAPKPALLCIGFVDLVFKLDLTDKDLEKKDAKDNDDKYYKLEDFTDIKSLEFLKNNKSLWDRIVLKPGNDSVKQLLVGNKASKKKCLVEYIGYGRPKFEGDEEFFEEIFTYVTEKNYLTINKTPLDDGARSSVSIILTHRGKTQKIGNGKTQEEEDEEKERERIKKERKKKRREEFKKKEEERKKKEEEERKKQEEEEKKRQEEEGNNNQEQNEGEERNDQEQNEGDANKEEEKKDDEAKNDQEKKEDGAKKEEEKKEGEAKNDQEKNEEEEKKEEEEDMIFGDEDSDEEDDEQKEKKEEEDYEENDAMKAKKIPKFKRKESVLCKLNPNQTKYDMFFINYSDLKNFPGDFKMQDFLELLNFFKKQGTNIFVNFYKPKPPEPPKIDENDVEDDVEKGEEDMEIKKEGETVENQEEEEEEQPKEEKKKKKKDGWTIKKNDTT